MEYATLLLVSGTVLTLLFFGALSRFNNSGEHVRHRVNRAKPHKDLYAERVH